MSTSKIKFTFIVVAFLSIFSLVFVAPILAASVAPVFVDGNPTCASLGYTHEYKPQPEPPPDGVYLFPDGVNSVTIDVDTANGALLSWSSTIGIDAVIMKGGSNANVYHYNPESLGDNNLVTPTNPNNGKPFGTSHITFCYDYEVAVTKDAQTTFVRTYIWDITKTGDQSNLTLSVGQSHVVNYSVKVEVIDFADTDWAVNGNIWVHNPDPDHIATVTGISDLLNGTFAGDVTCPSAFPIAIQSGATLHCTYTIAPGGAVNGTNVATATTSGVVGGGQGSAAVNFGAPTTEVNKCVDVSDSILGNLGTVCTNESPKTFNYSLTVGPYDTCGSRPFSNTASLDIGGSSTWDVLVDVPCATGCTLTQGYWKTHSERGPAPYDNTWAQLANGANTPFFDTGKTWHQVFWTPPAGNAFYNLAHQYMAAYLNQLNGANVPADVQAALAQAAGLLNQYDGNPQAMSQIKGSIRTQFLNLATLLDQYNNGNKGTPHCSE